MERTGLFTFKSMKTKFQLDIGRQIHTRTHIHTPILKKTPIIQFFFTHLYNIVDIIYTTLIHIFSLIYTYDGEPLYLSMLCIVYIISIIKSQIVWILFIPFISEI